MKRRTFIKTIAGSASAMALTTPLSVFASKQSAQSEKSLSLFNLHTGERLQLTYANADGYNADSLAKIAHLLRDRRTSEVHPIDVRTLDFLHHVWQSSGVDGEIGIISGYRSPKTNANLANKSGGVAKRSLHMQGKAIDFRIQGAELATIRDIAWQSKLGGVGYYPKDQFVHIDCGRVRFWGWQPS
ncbi:DUF882 domain-containing protein [Corallincola platygyrae]|uniref:Murein endopeptidase K n=1 Tax=Corallincola platygyrae TaxID=1193278 RepID=A0ABW4XQ70_9GAMM